VSAVFSTERLIIREWTLDEDDVEAAFAIYGDAVVMRHVGEPAATLQEARGRLERQRSRYGDGFGQWATQLRAGGPPIGSTCLHSLDGRPEIEVGWHFARGAWGHGYATEAAREALRYGFERLDLTRIVAVVRPENDRSRRVTQRLGMRHEGRTFCYGRHLDYFVLDAPAPAGR
jgi:RimJ/RimL family protein N-acetyltransferase